MMPQTRKEIDMLIEISSPEFSEIKWKLQGFHDADIEEFVVDAKQSRITIVMSGLYFVGSTNDPYRVVSKVSLHLLEADVVAERSTDDAFCSHSIVDFALDSGKLRIETGYGMREIVFGEDSVARIEYY